MKTIELDGEITFTKDVGTRFYHWLGSFTVFDLMDSEANYNSPS
jgi:hypothetical protein